MTHQAIYLSCELSRGPHTRLLLENADVSKPVFPSDSLHSLGHHLPCHLHHQLQEPGSKTVFSSSLYSQRFCILYSQRFWDQGFLPCLHTQSIQLLQKHVITEHLELGGIHKDD